jgi:hypothetical protein
LKYFVGFEFAFDPSKGFRSGNLSPFVLPLCNLCSSNMNINKNSLGAAVVVVVGLIVVVSEKQKLVNIRKSIVRNP